MSDGGINTESRSVLPPPNPYNLATLEAFRNGAQKSEKLKEYPDLVVILYGSFGKGLGHFDSDTDWMFLTSYHEFLREEAKELVADFHLGDEFNHLAQTDQKYGRLKERGMNIAGKGLVSAEFQDPRSTTTRLLVRQMESFEPFTDPRVNYDLTHFHWMIAALSAQVGINAHEVTSNTLQKHQTQLVNQLRAMASEDPNKYASYHETLKQVYRSYLAGKSTRLVDDQHKTEQGAPLLEFYRRFSEFPEVNELEEYITAKPRV